MKKKKDYLLIIALVIFNVSIFTDFLPFNTFLKLIAASILIIDCLHRKKKIAIGGQLIPLVLLNIVVVLNFLVGGDLSFIATFTTNILFIILATRFSEFARTEIKIMMILLIVHLLLAIFVELAPAHTVDGVFNKIILENYNSNYSWRNVSGINVGLTNQPGVLATYMVALIACFYALFINRKRALYLVGCVLAGAIIILTAKRAAIILSLATIIIIHAIFFNKKIKRKKSYYIRRFLLVIVIAALAAFLNNKFNLMDGILDKNTSLAGNDDLSNGRFSIWEDAITYFAERPVFGIGLKQYYYLKKYDIHNTYIQYLVETGLIGFMLFITCIIKVAADSVRSIKSKYEMGLMGMSVPSIVGIFMMTYLLLYGFVGNTFIDYAPLSLFITSVGLIYSDIKNGEEK